MFERRLTSEFGGDIKGGETRIVWTASETTKLSKLANLPIVSINYVVHFEGLGRPIPHDHWRHCRNLT